MICMAGFQTFFESISAESYSRGELEIEDLPFERDVVLTACAEALLLSGLLVLKEDV